MRQLRDGLLVPEVARLQAENYGFYWRRKMEAQMRRQGWQVGRDQTSQLMRLVGIEGVGRSEHTSTTRSDPAAVKPDDLVNRQFNALAPRRLWVADVTDVATWSGFAYVTFVTDVLSRRIVGWRVAATLKADVLRLQALDLATWDAGGDLAGLVHHADRESNYLAVVCTDRMLELGAKPSTGSIGDIYDDALAEAVNGLFKTELIRRHGPWRTFEQVELATLEWVWWWNNSRLPGELDRRTGRRIGTKPGRISYANSRSIPAATISP